MTSKSRHGQDRQLTAAPVLRGDLHVCTQSEGGYSEAARRMLELARTQPGLLGVEPMRDGLGITVSYRESEEAIRAWCQGGKRRNTWLGAILRLVILSIAFPETRVKV
jgi:heme-degrading monooxygenase HmoA